MRRAAQPVFALLPALALLLGPAPAPAAPPPPGAATPPPDPAGPYRPAVLTAAQAGADVALLRRALETIHPGLTRYQDKAAIDRAFARLEAAARRPIDTLALHREIAVLLAAIHCDHTKAEPPAALEAYRTTHPTHLPLRFRLIEGRMIVTANDGQPGAPPVGSELLTINGMPVPRLLLTLAPAVSYDGDTDQAIAAKLGDDSDLMGDDFDETYPSFFGLPTAWTLVWKTVGAPEAHTATLAPIDFTRWTALPAPGSRYREEFYKGITWRIGSKVAVLRIDTFVNYRNPVQPTALLGAFFRAMQAAGTGHLILDLRNNSGGSEDVSVALGRYLFDRPFVWSKPQRYKAIRYGDLPEHIDSWGDRAALFEPPASDFVRTAEGWYDRKPPVGADERDDDLSTIPHEPVSDARFAGRLTVLAGPANASGATRTIAQLKERAGAVVVGEDTGGSAEGPTAGQIFLLTLPASAIRVRIPNAWNRTNVAHFTPRRGVAADRLVVPTLADFEAGRDAALEIARSTPPSPAAPAPAAPATALADALAGDWTGTLDYRDYGDDGRVVLPAVLSARGGALAWTFDDGPGKTVRSAEQWAASPDGRSLTITEDGRTGRYRIVQFDSTASGTTLVADGEAEENGARVAARLVLTRITGRLRISQLTHRPGAPFLLRHSYELVQTEALRAQ